jgi:hypothetical protein
MDTNDSNRRDIKEDKEYCFDILNDSTIDYDFSYLIVLYEEQ